MKIATGILSWDGAERRSDRYGEIACFRSNYDEDAFCDPV